MQTSGAKGNALSYSSIPRLHWYQKQPLMGLGGNFLLEWFLSKYAVLFYKLSEKLKWKHRLLHRTPQGPFPSWHGRPLPSSLPHDTMASLGFGNGRQLPVCRQGQGTSKHPSARGKAGPTARLPTQRCGCQPALLPLQWFWEVAASPGLPAPARWQSKSWANWEKGSCLLLSLHRCCSWWPAAWTPGFLNGNFLFVFCFSPASENLAEMRFWAFTSLSVLVCNVPRKLRRKTDIAIFILLQFSFAADFEVIHFTLSCRCAKISQKVYISTTESRK